MTNAILNILWLVIITAIVAGIGIPALCIALDVLFFGRSR